MPFDEFLFSLSTTLSSSAGSAHNPFLHDPFPIFWRAALLFPPISTGLSCFPYRSAVHSARQASRIRVSGFKTLMLPPWDLFMYLPFFLPLSRLNNDASFLYFSGLLFLVLSGAFCDYGDPPGFPRLTRGHPLGSYVNFLPSVPCP